MLNTNTIIRLHQALVWVVVQVTDQAKLSTNKEPSNSNTWLQTTKTQNWQLPLNSAGSFAFRTPVKDINTTKGLQKCALHRLGRSSWGAIEAEEVV